MNHKWIEHNRSDINELHVLVKTKCAHCRNQRHQKFSKTTNNAFETKFFSEFGDPLDERPECSLQEQGKIQYSGEGLKPLPDSMKEINILSLGAPRNYVHKPIRRELVDIINGFLMGDYDKYTVLELRKLVTKTLVK